MAGQTSVTREEYLDSISQLISTASEIADGLSITQLTWQPESGERWSILECFDHLAVFNDAYLDAMEAALPEARAGATAGSFRAGGFLSAKFLGIAEPPPRNRFRAPGKIQPRPTLHPETMLPNYLKTMDRVSRVVESSKGKDLNSVRFRNPIAPLLRFTVGTGFLIIAAHARRHTWQAEQVLREPDFPR